ncbi:MAG: M16 family metallopeptidase [Thermodesulfobacteriota bacterium]
MYRKTTLDNGVRIVTEKVDSRVVSVGIWVEVGSRDEHDLNSGSAHFVEHMFFKGTARRSAQQLARELDVLGGMSNAFTANETTCFYATVLDDRVERLVELFADIFLNSLFNPEEVEREREVILQEISMVEDTPDDQIHELFNRQLWGRHPLGNTVLGPREVVGALSAQHLLDYVKRFYRPERVLIVAAGNVEHDAFCGLWRKELAGFAAAKSAPPARTLPEPVAPQRLVYPKPLEQVHMVLGTYGLSIAAEERYALFLLNILLGGNMSSRLFQEIREKRGLAYSVYSYLNSHRDCGVVAVYLGIDPGVATEAMGLVQRELTRFAHKPVPAEELAEAKDYARAGVYLSVESMETRMSQLARNELYFQREVPLGEVVAGIEAVTAAEIRTLAATLFSRPLSVAALGPLQQSSIDWSVLNH